MTELKEDATPARRIVFGTHATDASAGTGFHLEEHPVPRPDEGELLLKVLYLSLDAAPCGRFDARALRERAEGEVVAQVVFSRHPDFRAGEFVLSRSGWCTHAVRTPAQILRRLDPAQAPLSTALGVYGTPGFTAWAALRETGRPRPGETVVVADAGGVTGSVAGQIARLRGARVVGLAGGARACVYVRDVLGFDVAVNSDARHVARRLRAACPDGIDVYVENAGGALWQVAWPLLNERARIPVCGWSGEERRVPVRRQRSGAGAEAADRLPGMMRGILARGLALRGFIQREFLAYYPEFLREMGDWLRSGLVRYREDLVDGLENAPRALAGLLEGRYLGKPLVRVASPD